ncbi:MAG: ABC-F family ATP-binding cassette domain-containing protein [bacterium]|nr:ABC-F family ATP-binding cassette domain-containing protein [bacterium]
MRLLHLNQISLTLPGRTLLEPLTWSVFHHQRFGLIGPNGAGKTTLLKIINEMVEPSSGRVERARDLTIGYLPQEGIQHSGKTLFEEAWCGLPDLPSLERELAALRERVSHGADDPECLERLGVVQHRWEDLEGYRAEAKVAEVLAGLGFKETDRERGVEEFSGGWQMRIALAKLLLQDPDLLLLDEPTNHLDLPALLWLEEFLRRSSAALILVSHDRRFLDRLADGIVEIERGRLTIYTGNYSSYETTKAQRVEQQEAEAERLREEKKRIEAFVERFRYKASKASQVQSRVKTLERMRDVETATATRRVRFRFPPAPPGGKWALELKHLGHAYGTVKVLHELVVLIARGEKTALVGVNGAGKSTLCRIIAGIEKPTAGECKLGHHVNVGYFAQEADFHLSPDHTLLEEMEAMSRGATQQELRGLLGAFLFSGDDVQKKVSVLSGGEKARLALARMLLYPANLLILDEPTNHLDMLSQDVLLDALNAYDGTLIVASHDRHFLDRLVNRVLEVDGGQLRDFPGNLSEYMERKGLIGEPFRQRDETSGLAATMRSPEGRIERKELKRLEAEVRNRHSEQIRIARHELEGIQKLIERQEARKLEIEPLLAEEALYRDPESCRSLLSEYDRIRGELPRLMDKWEQLALRVAKMEKHKDDELQALRGSNV